MKTATSLVVLSLLFVNTLIGKASAQEKACRILAMSGGANKGAYEAGVAHGLAHLLDPADVAYDIVTGVSAGALNAAGMSVWAPNETVEMSEWMLTLWRNLTNEQVYQTWPGGFTEGLFNRSGVLDDSPLLNYVTNIYNTFGAFKKHIVVSAVDTNSGKYVAFSDSDTDFTDFPLRVVSSASIPFVFPHRHVGDYILMDGGTVWNVNFITAIDKCLEKVEDQSQIIMDIIICDNDKINSTLSTTNSIGNYLRYWSISSYNKGIRDVIEFQRAFPKIQYRYFFIPSKPLAWGLDLLSFTPEVIDPMIKIGQDDAQTMVGKGKGKAFEKLNAWAENEEIRKQHPILSDYIHRAEE